MIPAGGFLTEPATFFTLHVFSAGIKNCSYVAPVRFHYFLIASLRQAESASGGIESDGHLVRVRGRGGGSQNPIPRKIVMTVHCWGRASGTMTCVIPGTFSTTRGRPLVLEKVLEFTCFQAWAAGRCMVMRIPASRIRPWLATDH